MTMRGLTSGLTRGLTRWRSFFPDDITASELDELFADLIREPCSDWYVAAGREVRIRTCSGDMKTIHPGRIVHEDALREWLVEKLRRTPYRGEIRNLYFITPDNQWIPDFTTRLPPSGIVFAHTFTDREGRILGRLRIHVHLVVPVGFERQWRGLAFSARRIPESPPTPDALGFPPAALRLVNDIVERRLSRGLVLIAGPTGSGKTTTLASILQQINQHQPLSILAIEKPVEFMYPVGLSTIHQVEIPTCVASCREAGLNVRQQRADVIAIGEILDADTAAMAVELALTGHLVLATLPAATTGYHAVLKMLEFGVPGPDLSRALQSVVAQRLISPRDLCGVSDPTLQPILIMEVGRLPECDQLRQMILQPDLLNSAAFHDALDGHQGQGLSISLEESIFQAVIRQQIPPAYGLLLAEHKPRYLNLLFNLHETIRQHFQAHGFQPGRRPPEEVPPAIEKECAIFFFIRDFVENHPEMKPLS